MERDYISPIREKLEEGMHRHCAMFMAIGNGGDESPRWFNFGDQHYEEEEGRSLKIMSTQRGGIFFWVPLPLDYPYILVDEFWTQFKTFRTEFLIKNYPTINPY